MSKARKSQPPTVITSESLWRVRLSGKVMLSIIAFLASMHRHRTRPATPGPDQAIGLELAVGRGGWGGVGFFRLHASPAPAEYTLHRWRLWHSGVVAIECAGHSLQHPANLPLTNATTCCFVRSTQQISPQRLQSAMFAFNLG